MLEELLVKILSTFTEPVQLALIAFIVFLILERRADKKIADVNAEIAKATASAIHEQAIVMAKFEITIRNLFHKFNIPIMEDLK